MSSSIPIQHDDASLLAAFVESGSEEAFRQIVDRHLRMVHAAAKRQVRNDSLADDVTQAVFILLASKAKSIRRPARLAGWLVNATHFASRDARKLQYRRAIHERKAAEMTPESRTSDADILSMLPVLDESMSRLRDGDRAAVALRYLEGRSISEVAGVMHVSESAAAKRIERAVARLRILLARRSVVLPATGIVAGMLSISHVSAASLPAQTITTSAIAAAKGIAGGSSASSLALAKGAGHFMAVAKIKIATAIVAAGVVVAGTGVAVHRTFDRGPGAASSGNAPSPLVTPVVELKTQLEQAPSEPTEDGVTGLVRLRGKAPEMKPIDTSSVQGCQHDKPLLDERIVVSPQGGLANAVVSLKSIEGINLPDFSARPRQPVMLDQKGCRYVPHVVAVQVGQPVKMSNSDPLLHNVHTQPEKNSPDNIAEPNIDPGKLLKAPTDPEYYHIKCDIHPWMSAWIAVIDNPFFAVTDANGRFVLPKGLPDGAYTLHVWQEKLGEMDTPLKVEAGRGKVEFIYEVDREK